MDVVGGEEVLAAARGVEVGEPGGRRVSRHGRHEFGVGGFGVEKGLDSVGGLLRGHRWGHACVAVVRLVEGEHPFWGVGALDHRDGVGDVRGEGHHGDVGCCCVAGCTGVAAHGESNPVGGGGYGIEHAGVVAAVEGHGFHVGWAAAGTRAGAVGGCGRGG